jgi:RHS repeat-associated protein
MAFDRSNRLTQITYSGPMGTLALTQGRDNAGQLTSETVVGGPPNGPISYGYDKANRQTSADFGIAQFAYQYDPADRMTQITSTSGSTTLVSQLTYDAADQLQSMTTQSGSATTQKLSFNYDSDGNRVQRTDNLTGNATNYGYDQANHLVNVAGSVLYGYNADGLRMTKTVNGITQAYTWGVSGQLPILIQDGATRYVTGPGGLPLEQIAADGTVRYYHQDALGSTRALTNARGQLDSAYLYDSYGKLLAFTGSNAPNPFQYAGQYVDAETGFVYLRARYYDPSTAQYTSRDPLSSLIGHPYSYAGDSPLNATDPTGLFPGENLWKILGPHFGQISALTGALAFGLGFLSLTGIGALLVGGLEGVSLASGALAAIWTCTHKMDWQCAVSIAGAMAGGFSLLFKGIGTLFQLAAEAKAAAASATWASDAFILVRALKYVGLKTLQGIYSVFSDLSRQLATVWAGLAVALHTIAAVAETLKQILEAGTTSSGPASSPSPSPRPAPC